MYFVNIQMCCVWKMFFLENNNSVMGKKMFFTWKQLFIFISGPQWCIIGSSSKISWFLPIRSWATTASGLATGRRFWTISSHVSNGIAIITQHLAISTIFHCTISGQMSSSIAIVTFSSSFFIRTFSWKVSWFSTYEKSKEKNP